MAPGRPTTVLHACKAPDLPPVPQAVWPHRPAGFADRVVPMHDQYWQTEEAMAEGAPDTRPGP